MQNKGAIRLFAILLALVCIYQLSFTFFTQHYEKKAKELAKGDVRKETAFLDSISGKIVYNILIRKYSFQDCKERELNLGLDLKGGMNVMLEVSVYDIIKALSNYSKDVTLNKALELAREMQKSSQSDYLTLFGKAFKQVDPNAKLSAIFNTVELKNKINFNSTNEQVLSVIRAETEGAIKNSFNVLRSRIDRFGVVSPNIQRMENSGRILIELPGVKDPERVRNLLQSTANLEFWETYENTDMYQHLLDANTRIKEIQSKQDSIDKSFKNTAGVKADNVTDSSKAKADSSKTLSLLEQMQKDTTQKGKLTQGVNDFEKNYPLFALLRPNVGQDNKLMPGSTVGYAHYKDTSKVNYYLTQKYIRSLFPRDVKFLWSLKPFKYDKAKSVYELHAIRITGRDGRAPLTGDVIVDARKDFGQTRSEVEVSMSMNGEGTKIWARMTGENVGKCIAIVLDNCVVSAPRVNQEIKGGNSQITGDFTPEEADDLANKLKSGKLSAPARIISEAVVGPTLGKEAIRAGLISFIIAFIGVLIYMALYYNRAGNVANIALFTNVVFLFGVLSSIGAVLTLPGIAGMVLTLAMAVDGNVIIYERMREEVRAGKGMRLVVKDGFWHAYSSIIDGHVTTILTGIVLYIFGSGPVQGFATTLVIGLLLSLFSSIFIARLLFETMLDRDMNITLGNKFTLNTFTKVNINFIGVRKIMYVASSIVIGIGIISLFIRGLDPSVEFTGGRTYIIRFEKPVKTVDIRNSLTKVFKDAPEVKTFGGDDQVKITTKFLIDDKSTKADSIVDATLFMGLKSHYDPAYTYADFSAHSDTKKVGEMSSQKVDPTFSDDLIWQAFLAVFFALVIIFIYIALRFKDWKFGLGGVVSLFHDTLVVVTMFTLFYGILPFSLEIDQQFVAALLTIIGYSIMDTVIIFDRIREYTKLYPKRDLETNINSAINSTLGRTINTSGITIVVLLVIFIFGGEILRGFIFALLVGVTIGTYSSVFNATPVAYDLIMWGKRKALKEAKTK